MQEGCSIAIPEGGRPRIFHSIRPGCPQGAILPAVPDFIVVLAVPVAPLALAVSLAPGLPVVPGVPPGGVGLVPLAGVRAVPAGGVRVVPLGGTGLGAGVAEPGVTGLGVWLPGVTGLGVAVPAEMGLGLAGCGLAASPEVSEALGRDAPIGGAVSGGPPTVREVFTRSAEVST